MRIIKESTGAHCVLRTDTYAHSFAHIKMLSEEAMKDFPLLEAKDIEVVKYGGQRYAKTYGIEFPIPNGASVPADYQPIENLEFL